MIAYYLDLTDYLAIVTEVTGLDAETAIRVTNLELADSALHAPRAGWGDTESLPRIRRESCRHRHPTLQVSLASHMGPGSRRLCQRHGTTTVASYGTTLTIHRRRPERH
ncbi:MAG: hypothetical protein ACRDZR_12715, partial [Acidimicrobiales bacterium]